MSTGKLNNELLRRVSRAARRRSVSTNTRASTSYRAASIVASLIATLGAPPAFAQALGVEIYNNTDVDLCVDRTSPRDCVELKPGETRRVAMRRRHWINFGMESHKYHLPKKVVEAHAGRNAEPLRLQAENDGKLYFVPRASNFPARPLPRQPSGFPLAPKRVVDLT